MEKYLNVWREIVAIAQNFIHAPNFKRALAWGITLHLIALFTLIRGDIYYMDDWINSANDGLWNHGRYVATFILNSLATFGKSSLDMSPLPQIFGVLFVVISSMILISLIRKKLDLLGIIASLPLGLSPYFLQNLSYRFDALTMGIALFLAIVPFLFKDNKRVFSAISVVCLLLMLMTYQAANATYIVLSLYFAFSLYFLEQRYLKESVIFLAICVVNLIVASLLFILIANPIDYGDAYVSNKPIPLNGAFVLGVWDNLSEYLATIFSDFKQTPYIWLVALISALFTLNIAIHSNRPKIATIPSAIIFLMLGIALSYGLYLVLQKPLFEPRAFYGINAFIATLCIANVSILDSSRYRTQNDKTINSLSAPPRLRFIRIAQILHYTSATIAIITAYFLISFANIYANALKKQDEYLDFRAQLLLQDLSDKVPKGGNVMVYVESHISDNHPVAQRFIDKYGTIARMIPKTYMASHFVDGYNWDWGFCELIESVAGSEVIFKNVYHTIKKAKSCYIITQNK